MYNIVKEGNYLHRSPTHIRKKLSANLSPELFEKYQTRSISVRKGDTVIIMRGAFQGVEGKITRAVPKKRVIYVEGITREKIDGTTVPVPIHSSKVRIKNLNLDDKRRKETLERRSKSSS